MPRYFFLPCNFHGRWTTTNDNNRTAKKIFLKLSLSLDRERNLCKHLGEKYLHRITQALIIRRGFRLHRANNVRLLSTQSTVIQVQILPRDSSPCSKSELVHILERWDRERWELQKGDWFDMHKLERISLYSTYVAGIRIGIGIGMRVYTRDYRKKKKKGYAKRERGTDKLMTVGKRQGSIIINLRSCRYVATSASDDSCWWWYIGTRGLRVSDITYLIPLSRFRPPGICLNFFFYLHS